jgi:hypothetical protein
MAKDDLIAVNCGQTAVSFEIVQLVGGKRELESVPNSILRWYIEPMMKMDGAQGFLVLMVLLPLYEKHLKVNGHIGKDENFSEGHRVFRVIGRDLRISMDEAYYFWQCFRNGLLHTALPNELESFQYSLREEGPPIERKNGVFYINPFELRNHLLEIIMRDLKKWKSHDDRIPVTYIPRQNVDGEGSRK